MKLKRLILTTLLATALLLAAGCRAADEYEPEPQPEPTPAPAPAPVPEPPLPPEEEDELFQEFFAYEGPELVMFHIADETFREFIETADATLMGETMFVEYFRASPQSSEIVVRWVFGDEQLMKDESMLFGTPYAGIYVDIDLVETYGTTEGIEGILSMNGINETVEAFFLFYHWFYTDSAIPLTIAAYTQEGVYFIGISLQDGVYEYKVYTHAEYYQAYREYIGALYVNGVRLQLGENEPLFQGRRTMTPLRAVLEALGSDIEVEAGDVSLGRVIGGEAFAYRISMRFTRGGSGYILEITEGIPEMKDMATDEYMYEEFEFMPGSLTFDDEFESTDDFEPFINEKMLQGILERIGASVEVDHNTREIRVIG